MRSTRLTLCSFFIALVAAAAAGCGGARSTAGAGAPVTTLPPSTGQRAIEEADIIQLDGGLLYALSKSGTVSIVDIATPGRLDLLGQATLRGEPFEMYRRGDFLIAMSNDAVGTDETWEQHSFTAEFTPRSKKGHKDFRVSVIDKLIKDSSRKRLKVRLTGTGSAAAISPQGAE